MECMPVLSLTRLPQSRCLHARTRGVTSAFDHFKTIFSVSDLLQLRSNETLLLAFGGRLKIARCQRSVVGKK